MKPTSPGTRRPPGLRHAGALCCAAVVAIAAASTGSHPVIAALGGVAGLAAVLGALWWRRELVALAILVLGTAAALSLPSQPATFVVASLEGLALWLLFDLVWQHRSSDLLSSIRLRQVGAVALCTAVADPLVAVAGSVRPAGVGWFVAGVAALLAVLGVLARTVQRAITAPQASSPPDGDVQM